MKVFVLEIWIGNWLGVILWLFPYCLLWEFAKIKKLKINCIRVTDVGEDLKAAGILFCLQEAKINKWIWQHWKKLHEKIVIIQLGQLLKPTVRLKKRFIVSSTCRLLYLGNDGNFVFFSVVIRFLKKSWKTHINGDSTVGRKQHLSIQTGTTSDNSHQFFLLLSGKL